MMVQGMLRAFLVTLCLPWAFASRALQASDIVYPLRNIRPEGIHRLSRNEANLMGLGEDRHVLVSELLFGGVKAVNLANGDVTQVVQRGEARDRLGVDVNFGNGYILVLGAGFADGGADALRVYDAATGSFVTSCLAPAEQGGFMLDVEVVGNTAYVTDAVVNALWTVDLTQVSSGSSCEMVGIVLPAQWFLPRNDVSFMAVGKFVSA